MTVNWAGVVVRRKSDEDQEIVWIIRIYLEFVLYQVNLPEKPSPMYGADP